MDDEQSLHWHALNYRTAATPHAEAMWLVLEAFVAGTVAQAVASERERCAAVAESFAEQQWARWHIDSNAKEAQKIIAGTIRKGDKAWLPT